MDTSNDTSKANPKSTKHSFQLVYYFSRFAGLWPFTIAYDSNGSIKGARVHLFDILWFLVSISLYFESLYYAFDDMNSSHKSVTMYISHLPSLLFGPVGIVLNMFNRRSLANILNQFIIFDNKVGALFLYDY